MLISPNNTVLVSEDNNVCKITLNRPQSLNALNLDMLEALLHITSKLKSPGKTRAIILEGSGDHFMAGGDVKDFNALLEREKNQSKIKKIFEKELDDLHRMIINMREIPIPIISSLKGAVAGAGVSFLLASDLAVCSEDTLFTLAYRHIGTSPDGGSTYFLPRTIGLKRAMELALLGDHFDAKKALDFGLVNWVVPQKKLASQTFAIAKKIVDGPAYALGKTKKLLNSSLDSSLKKQLKKETKIFLSCVAKNDFHEGVLAFYEKRKPKFI